MDSTDKPIPSSQSTGVGAPAGGPAPLGLAESIRYLGRAVGTNGEAEGMLGGEAGPLRRHLLMKTKDGERHWVTRFWQQPGSSFVCFTCEHIPSHYPYELMVNQDQIASMQFLPEAFFKADARPRSGFEF